LTAKVPKLFCKSSRPKNLLHSAKSFATFLTLHSKDFLHALCFQLQKVRNFYAILALVNDLMKYLLKLLPLIPLLVVFLFSLYLPTDPDLGWHLKYGEYFFQHGSVLRDNAFSTMMPGYQWANTSWLTDVLTYVAFHFGGFLGLSLLGALVVTLTFYFYGKVAKLTVWDQAFLFAFLLYLEQPVNAVSFRGQQISLLLIGILYFLISFYKTKPKVFLLLIPLFLLWANLNGEFLLGLVLFALWIALYLGQKIYYSLSESKGRNIPSLRQAQALKTKVFFSISTNVKEIRYLIGVFIACLVATVINPFGIGIHTAALSHVGSPLLKDISEYLPFEMYSQVWWNQVAVGILLVLGFITLFFKGKVTEKLPLLISSLLLFLLSFEVRRYAWPAYYLILPLLTPLARYFKPDGKKGTVILTTIFLCLLLGIGVKSQYPFTKYFAYTWDGYCMNQISKCSPSAAQFVKEHHLTQNLYTLYGWGGWLIWNYPTIKPSIDGRMHLWNTNGYSAFTDYFAYEQDLKNIDDSSYNVVLMSPDKPVYTRLRTLTNQDKWELVYEDQVAGVFVRKN
jgi:hypothetical protein